MPPRLLQVVFVREVEHVELPQLVPRVPEELAHSGVCAKDPTSWSGHPHSDGSVVERAAEPLFALAQHVLCPAPVTGVARHRQHANRPALVVADRIQAERCVDRRPVGAALRHPDVADGVTVSREGDRLEQLPPMRFRHDECDRLTECVRRADPVEALGAADPPEDRAVQRQLDDRRGRCPADGIENVLGARWSRAVLGVAVDVDTHDDPSGVGSSRKILCRQLQTICGTASSFRRASTPPLCAARADSAAMADDPDLDGLREQIAAIDHEVLRALNRRLELVGRVQDRKHAAGTRLIDAGREAELLQQLADANDGPLSEHAVQTLFAAVLDVMKQELQGELRGDAEPARAGLPAGIETVAVVGTGLLGTSVALAARRAGVQSLRGWDADEAILRESAGAGAIDRPASSLAEAVDGADLVVVAVPVGALAATVLLSLAAAGSPATVTDVGSTKRGLAAIEDARFVPGHPIAGGHTGGPTRASVDLFDAATWLLTPLPSTDPARVDLVEQFVAALGARVVRLGADEHDRLLALTSHLPHALANLLMCRVAAGGEEALGFAGASLREMTRVAGANPAMWADIFVENGDLIAEALAAHRDEVGTVEAALRQGDRAFFEEWIASSAAARGRMLGYAYQTDARALNRVRVRVPDRPGVLARITQRLGAAGINIEDFELRHVSPDYGGVLVLLVTGAENAELARTLLRRDGYSAA